MFVSMLKAGVAFRTTVTYLIASPLLNPVIVGGIWLTLSWQVAISYAVIMVLLSLGAPWVWTALGMEDQLRKVKVKGGRQLDGTPWRGIKQETPGSDPSGMGRSSPHAPSDDHRRGHRCIHLRGRARRRTEIYGR